MNKSYAGVHDCGVEQLPASVDYLSEGSVDP
jgi:hypothetical protein